MLYLKKSIIPGAGKGLFTDHHIKRGEEIVEYKGEIVPWSEVEKRALKGHEGYAFYISERYTVDAYYTKWAMGRYANDATGFGRVKGLRNNSQYVVKRKNGIRKVFIVASRNILPGTEILVSYGGDYWRYINKKPKKKPISKKNSYRKAA